MAKTKPQAQKEAEKKARHDAEKAAYLIEKAARDEKLRKQYEESKSQETTVLSKKDRRKLKQQQQEQERISRLEKLSLNAVAEENASDKAYAEKSPQPKDHTMEKALADAEQEQKSTSRQPSVGRIVTNHTTYCEGLKPVLTRLQRNLPGCTIQCGELKQKKDSKTETLELSFKRATDEHIFKFVARKGYTVQEVLISVPKASIVSQDIVCDAVEKALGEKLKQPKAPSKEEEDLSYSQYNHTRYAERQSFWKDEHQQKHQAEKAKTRQAEKEKKIQEQSRKLATKGVAREQREENATRDVEIISGEKRGKYSMSN